MSRDENVLHIISNETKSSIDLIKLECATFTALQTNTSKNVNLYGEFFVWLYFFSAK